MNYRLVLAPTGTVASDSGTIMVHDYGTFRSTVLNNGIPDSVSFSCETESTAGYDCALWLCNHCHTQHLPFPEYSTAGANASAKARIDALLEHFSYSHIK